MVRRMKTNTETIAHISERTDLKVIIVYDEYDSGAHAMEIYARLVEGLAPDCGFDLRLWKFEPMGIPELAAEAAEEALSADLIVVSLNGNHPLPPEVHPWLDLWLAERTEPGAFGLLLNGSPNREVESFFADVARAARLDFVTNQAEQEWPKALIAPEPELVAHTFVFHEQPSPSRWGINE